MPMKTWAAYERLTADDLNAALEWLRTRAEPVPGAIAHSSAVTPGLNIICKLDVLDAGRAAMMDAANSRFVIPAGLGGLWRISAVMTAANTAAAERHIGSIWRNGAGIASQYAYPNVGGTLVVSVSVDVILAAGDLISFNGASTVTADWTVQATLSLVSIGGLA